MIVDNTRIVNGLAVKSSGLMRNETNDGYCAFAVGVAQSRSFLVVCWLLVGRIVLRVSLSLSVGGGGRCNSIQLDPIPQHAQDQTAKQRERGKTRTKRKERVGQGDARLPNGKVRHLNVQLTKLLLGQFVFPPSTRKETKKKGPSLLFS